MSVGPKQIFTVSSCERRIELPVNRPVAFAWTFAPPGTVTPPKIPSERKLIVTATKPSETAVTTLRICTKLDSEL